MSSFSVATLQEKLSRLSASQESIETLSLWILHHKAFAKTSVAVWTDGFVKAEADHRLVLLYLANDILQNGKRKGADMFTDLFRESLEQVVPLICDQKIQSSVERMLRIWRDRKVYGKAFVRHLEQLLSGKTDHEKEVESTVLVVAVTTPPVTTPPPEPLPNFKMSLLEDAVLELRKFEGEMRIKEASIESLPIEIWDASSLGLLKDKSEGEEFSGKFDKAWNTLKEYSDCLGIEVSERVNISNMLAACLAQQAQELARVQQDMKIHKALMVQLTSCCEKLNVRQKDLDRAQQTATSDPSCKEDLTEVGDMEIDSEEENMETQVGTRPPHPVSSFPAPPKMFTSDITSTTPLLGSTSTSKIISSAPQMINSAPQMISSAPQMISSAPQMIYSAPQMINSAPQMITSTPQLAPQMMNDTLNSAPLMVTPAPPMMNVSGPSLGQGGAYPQPYPPHPPMTGFTTQPQRYPRPPMAPLGPVMMSQRMPTHTPPTGMPPRYAFGGPPAHPGGPPQSRGPPPRPELQFSGVRPHGPLSQPGDMRPQGPGGTRSSGPEVRGQEAHIESKPVLYRTEVGQTSSLDDRLQSLVVKKSLGSVLLQEYADSEGSGDRPYTPTTTPLPPSPGDPDDESVTTPTPQLDMSPVTPEDVGTPQFNPANPIMKALYHSPEEASTAPSTQPAVAEDSLLSGVDTGMLQTILKNVHVLKTPDPSGSPPSTRPTDSASPPPTILTPLTTQTPSSTPPPLTTTTAAATPQDKPRLTTAPAAGNIKITSSLTTLLDEIFPQLSKSLQERKRKQKGSDAEVVKQPKLEPHNVEGSDMRPPATPPRLNGPRPNGGFPPRGPMVLMRPVGRGGVRPPGMILISQRPVLEGGARPPGMILRPQRPPPEGNMRLCGPPFEGNFRPRGPPGLDGNFRPPGPPRPGMQLVRDRFQCSPGPRPPFRPRNPNSAPPPHPPFSSFQPPPISRPPFVPGDMPPQRLPRTDSGMEPNHFVEKPPQSHDSLQSIPPSGMGMWP